MDAKFLGGEPEIYIVHLSLNFFPTYFHQLYYNAKDIIIKSKGDQEISFIILIERYYTCENNLYRISDRYIKKSCIISKRIYIKKKKDILSSCANWRIISVK